MANKFAAGKKALGLCDNCGFTFKLKLLREVPIKNKNVNLKFCAECWNVSHPQLMLGTFPISDAMALRNPRPDTASTDGSRDIQWGWNPVGMSSQNSETPNYLVATGQVGTVTVTIT